MLEEVLLGLARDTDVALALSVVAVAAHPVVWRAR
jgi:hypothetical protein